MFGYLRRLATTGAAYTASSVLSKLIAVALLPIYTRYLTPADYGAAEVMLTGVVAASIVVRLGVIEALMRFYFIGGQPPNEVVRSGFASLFWTTTIVALLALPFAGPISDALLGEPDAGLARIAIAGLWVFTLYEYLVSLFRLDERARTYFFFTVANVLVAIPLTVFFVVAEDRGADGLLLGIYGAALPFLVIVAIDQRRRLGLIPKRDVLRRMMRFGLPTMPAELSLYSLQFIDRILLARLSGLAAAGLYSLAVKFGQSVTVVVRGFQLAWPPLAYSVEDDDEARSVYALVVTWFVAVCAFVVVGMWLESRQIARFLATPEFFDSFKAVGLVSTGIAMYALYLVLVVILGRTGRTEFNFPATGAGTLVNIGLNLLLLPSMGIVGAGVSLVASYAVILVLMYVFTQRLFKVPYEWLRLGQAVGLAALLVLAGELLLPTSGFGGLAGRTALWLAYPLLLWVTGFLNEEEREAAGRVLSPAYVMASLRSLREAPPPEPEEEEREEAEEEERRRRGPRLTRETLEAEQRDEDAIR
jgi:O-antigen/teichoic acid export membrane protein